MRVFQKSSITLNGYIKIQTLKKYMMIMVIKKMMIMTKKMKEMMKRMMIKEALSKLKRKIIYKAKRAQYQTQQLQILEEKH